MFIGREHELSVLNKLYMSDKFEFAVIYGRSCRENCAYQSVYQ